MSLTLYTIGFTQKTAQRFFGLLAEHQINCLVDIRIHPNSQLSGFAKQNDLPYFLEHLLHCEYYHDLRLAPTETLLSTYRKERDWTHYEQHFEQLLDERNIPGSLDKAWFAARHGCFLCSEATPEYCHRRLVTERLQRYWQDVNIVHIM